MRARRVRVRLYKLFELLIVFLMAFYSNVYLRLVPATSIVNSKLQRSAQCSSDYVSLLESGI